MESDRPEDKTADETRRTEIIESRIGAPTPPLPQLLKGRYHIERELDRGVSGLRISRDERLHSCGNQFFSTLRKSVWLTEVFAKRP
jgi:hypothetical protein